MCKLLAPIDLADVPVYVESASTLDERYRRIRGANGFTSSTLDLEFRDSIKRRWQGRGVAIWVNDIGIERQLLDAEYARLFLPSFYTVVVHELAHIFQRRQLIGDIPDDVSIDDRRERTIGNVASYEDAPVCGPRAKVPWTWHEFDFVRLMIHLHHRAAQLGFSFHLTSTCAGPYYGLSSAWLYQAACDDEPELMRDASFVEIKQAPMRVDFWDLWGYDMDRWEQQQKTEDAATAAAQNP